MSKVNKVMITTDGSVFDGKGGYGYIVRDDENNRTLARAKGGVKIDDIDQVELIAVLQAVRYIDKKMKEEVIDPKAQIELFSDSKRNRMIMNEGRIEPIEANIARWREIKHLTKDWNFKLDWVKSHVSDLDREFMSEEKIRKHTYNNMADVEAKKGRYLESATEEVVEKGEVVKQDGYVDPHPELSAVKLENTFPQVPTHNTINNSGARKPEEETWTKNSGTKKTNYLQRYANMRKSQHQEAALSEVVKPVVEKTVVPEPVVAPASPVAEVPKVRVSEAQVGETGYKQEPESFKSRLRVARGRFGKPKSENSDSPKFKTVDELNAEQGYKSNKFK